MKTFRVVTERDGAITKRPGETITPIVRTDIRYCAESIDAVWEIIKNLRHDPDVTLVAIVQEDGEVIIVESGK
jgi:hypothetical protein